MTIMAILEILLAALQFPKELLALARFLSKAPETKRQEMLAKIAAESATLDQGGRPSWED